MRLRNSGITVVAFGVALISGCGGGIYTVDPVFTRSPDGTSSAFYKKEGVNGSLFSKEVVVDFESTEFKRQLNGARQTLSERNNLLLKLVVFSDQICTDHLGSIKGTSSTTNVGLGLFTSLFSGLASISAGTAAKTYAATSTVTNSSRSLVNEEVYRQHFADAIIEKISESRKAKRNAVIAGLDAPLASYSIDRGITDLIEYHQQCSFYRGAASLLDAAKKRPTEGGEAPKDGTTPGAVTDATTVINPIVAERKVDASVATLGGGYSRYELSLVDTNGDTRVTGLKSSVVTGASISIDLAELAKKFSAGTLVSLQSFVYKTPSALPVVRGSTAAVFYPTLKDASIDPGKGALDPKTGKSLVTLTFPKNYDQAYTTLTKEILVNATLKDDEKVKFKEAKCAPDKDGKCAIEFEPVAPLSETAKSKNFFIKLTTNFELPAISSPEIEVVVTPPAK